MKIIKASIADVPRMMGCARECCLEHGDSVMGGKLDESHYAGEWKKLISSGSGIMLLMEFEGEIVGGIGGIKHKSMLTGMWQAMQIFWYVRPDHRGTLASTRLILMLEQWAKLNQCVHVVMPLLDTMPEKTESFYQRSGYKKLETFYRKTL